MEKKQTDLTEVYCKGFGERFKKTLCSYFNRTDEECLLLKKNEMDEIWEKCRYMNFERFYNKIDKSIKRTVKIYGNQNIDDMGNFDFKTIYDRLKKIILKQPTLPVWVGYINKTIYNEIRKILDKQGIIKKEKKCGGCTHLSESKFCNKKQIIRNKTDDACEDYELFTPNIKTTAGEDGESQTTTDNTQEILEYKSLILFMKKMLNQRIESTAPGSKQRQKFKRQYELFLNLMILLDDDIEESEAKKILSGGHEKKYRMINNDITEIRNFFKKNCPELTK
ncbi:hypothetical protein QUF70_04820 [Desulfobacterales bacterium HSG17]|nr:hypothetical protein [Desulfobacterales bacterium HSG17]